MTLGSYWMEQKIDPVNDCPERGEFPHANCEVEMYKGGGPWSLIYGVCHGHKTIWHMSSGGETDPTWPTLAELDESYRRARRNCCRGRSRGNRPDVVAA
jgi:hypothetical protein